jgi:hypothetical protein
MQSVPITTDVSSNLDQGEVYNIMWLRLLVTSGGFEVLNVRYHTAQIIIYIDF